ncbi:hypothetical protein Tco_0312103 [Tanacetum coccineum]
MTSILGHDGDPKVSYWLRNVEDDLRAQISGLKFVMIEGLGLEVEDTPPLLESSLIVQITASLRKARTTERFELDPFHKGTFSHQYFPEIYLISN